MKIAYYVQSKFAKQNYKNECFNGRSFAGMLMVGDALTRAGYEVGYTSAATVNKYDVVLVSITSDCDWWAYISERLTWSQGNYTVIIGGAGVLNVRPFLPFADIFVLGRGEVEVPSLISSMNAGERYSSPSVIYSDDFDPDDKYMIAQSPNYPHTIILGGGKEYCESGQGCPNKCLFCGYTWQRKHTVSEKFIYRDGLIDLSERYGTLKDIIAGGYDYEKLRTTAMDGFSERLRYMVNKRISNEDLTKFLVDMGNSPKPHQIKLYNVANYPTETQKDWDEFRDILASSDDQTPTRDKQFGLILHTTPFRAMPATPAACWEMKYDNLRGNISKRLGAKGNSVFFKGKSYFAVESMGTDSLYSVILSNLVLRGTERDSNNIRKLCITPKFWSASARQKQSTLEKYFDVHDLFRAYTPDELPTKYLNTYTKLTYRHPNYD